MSQSVATSAQSAPPPVLAAMLRDFDGADTRLPVLESFGILDTAGEKSYDDIALLAAYLCHTQAAMISFFDRDRLWIKAYFTKGAIFENPADWPKNFAILEAAHEHPFEAMQIEDTATDPLFAATPLLVAGETMRFYAAASLASHSGCVIGAVSVMDPEQRHLTRNQLAGLTTLARQVMELLEMRRTVLGLSEANAQLGRQNLTDALTGIPNRRAYDEKLAEEVSRARRTGAPLSLLMIDVDHFKHYNDNFGHPAGDTALQSLARLLTASLRPYDFLARYGGEEFTVLLPSTALEGALTVAERTRALIAGSDFPHREFTVSIGVAQFDPAAGAKALVQTADAGLYRAKSNGRNRVAVGEPPENTKDGPPSVPGF